jgi:hypothetical protein
LYGAGTRRTVSFDGARFSAGLEFGRKFGVPQLVTINKSASYGFWWNRIRDFLISLRCRAAHDRNVARKLNQIDPWAEPK